MLPFSINPQQVLRNGSEQSLIPDAAGRFHGNATGQELYIYPNCSSKIRLSSPSSSGLNIFTSSMGGGQGAIAARDAPTNKSHKTVLYKALL